jgi:hypothetical protein
MRLKFNGDGSVSFDADADFETYPLPVARKIIFGMLEQIEDEVRLRMVQ